MLIFVDDFIITGCHTTKLWQFIEQACNQFRCQDLGELFYFLGLEIVQKDGPIKVTKHKYVLHGLATKVLFKQLQVC